MANKGRAYPRFFRRDLSLKPGGYCYLPDKWIWSGLVAHPGAYQWFSNQVNILDFIGYENFGRTLVWGKDIYPFPGLAPHRMRYYYRLTGDVNMVQEEWIIGNLDTAYTRVGPRYVQTTFPYSPLPTTWFNNTGSGFNFTAIGTFLPKGW